MKYRITTPQSQGFWEARITQSLQSFQFTQHLTKMGTSKNHAPLVTMRIPNHLTCATRNALGNNSGDVQIRPQIRKTMVEARDGHRPPGQLKNASQGLGGMAQKHSKFLASPSPSYDQQEA